MLFSEIYGSYFHVVAAVLREAAAGCLTERRMTEIVRDKAFAESTLSIPAALKQGSWPLLDRELHTVLRHPPAMPVTTLEKRWLKALLLDPRIALFEPDPSGLEDVEPLYQPDVFVRFDQYTDGDPYENETYIKCFRVVLQAIRERRMLRVRFRGRAGIHHSVICMPYQLEYSEKDDKFRLLAAERNKRITINAARIYACKMLGIYDRHFLPRKRTRELVMLLHDERNALERVLLHFSHFEKETRRLDGRVYEIRLRYDRSDETELLIRVLSFGPVLEVRAPSEFAGLIRERIERQCGKERG